MIQTRPAISILADEADFALLAMRAAVELIAMMARSPSGAMKKEDWTPVTATDFAVQAALRGLLEQSFPTAVMVAEEDSGRLRRNAARGWRDEIVAAVRRVHPDATEDKVLDWVDAATGSRSRVFGRWIPSMGRRGCCAEISSPSPWR
jgi:3'-phosphoadenosine 5'-phosphosulfate (PAPS) 3'-phosphatase